MEEKSSHTFPFPTRFFENFENLKYPWDVETSMVLLLGMLSVFQVLLNVKQLLNNTTQSSAPKLGSYEWQGVWDGMGKYLGEWAPPVFWNFTLEHMQNLEN